MLQRIKNTITIFDGGFGSEITKLKIKTPIVPEELNITNKEDIINIHKGYVNAGANFITTNSFGLNCFKIKRSKYSLEELVLSAIDNAKKANPEYIMFDIGPLGQLVEPMGNLTFDEAYNAFKEIVLIAKDHVDGFILETFTDVFELKIAILACKENSCKPVFATMSFEKNGRTLTGTTPEIMVNILEGLNVDALGVNCSLGPVEMENIISEIINNAHAPVIIQPNRGLPKLVNNETVYDLSVDEYVDAIRKYVNMGVSIIGGCCGTDKDFIESISIFKDQPINKVVNPIKSVVCSANKIVYVDDIKIVGERLNPTGKKKLKEAYLNNDFAYITNEAIKQEEALSDILDINVGIPKANEKELMTNVVRKIQEVSNICLQIDSSDPSAIEAGCRFYNGVALINSVNGNTDVMDRIFPIAKKYGAMVIGLTLDDNGVPKTAIERFNIAKRIVNYASKYGISKEKLVIDTLVLTASAEQPLVKETLKALRMVREELGVRTALGVSNVSFGLPNRGLLNKTFLTMAIANGLNLAIINPLDSEMVNAVLACNVLNNIDINSENYIKNNVEIVEKATTTDKTLEYVIKKGLSDIAKDVCLAELATKEPMDLINNVIVPSLNEVGSLFEKGKLFLPQLLKSAEATKAAFEVIKNKFNSNESSKATIILLTVKDDVHDIGKNIVKVVLESYGYNVIDLGKDVKIEDVVCAYHKYHPQAIGLSALMTTTVLRMEETIIELKKIEGMCPIFVGGAVLNQEIAKEIGADYYTADALECANLLERIL